MILFRLVGLKSCADFRIDGNNIFGLQKWLAQTEKPLHFQSVMGGSPCPVPKLAQDYPRNAQNIG